MVFIFRITCSIGLLLTIFLQTVQKNIGLEATYLISKSTSGQLGEYSPAEYKPSISSNGRYTVFSTLSSYSVWDLGNSDVYLHDSVEEETTLLSKNLIGFSGNSGSGYPSISGDGTRVVFSSSASDLVANDKNGNYEDIFLLDLVSNDLSLISVSTLGIQGYESSTTPSISNNGRYVAFISVVDLDGNSPNNFAYQIYLRDLTLQTTRLVSRSLVGEHGNSNSYAPSVSNDGSVVFLSDATNLIENDTNNFRDVYLYNGSSESIELISMSLLGGSANNESFSPDISANSEYVVFCSNANNLVEDDLAWTDCFVRDVANFSTEIISITSDGYPAGSGTGISISSDGSYIAFEGNLMYFGESYGGLSVIIMIDRNKKEYSLASITNNLLVSNGDSFYPEISGDGHSVAFYSFGSNYVSGDTNNVADIYLHRYPFFIYAPSITRN